MICNQRIPHLKWFIQGHTFTSDAKVLPLKCYDLILGEDWLEDHSPIWVNYKTKQMTLTMSDQKIPLQGVIDDTATCRPISSVKLSGLMRRGAVSHCIQMVVPSTRMEVPSICVVESVDHATQLPDTISSLLQEYDRLFD